MAGWDTRAAIHSIPTLISLSLFLCNICVHAVFTEEHKAFGCTGDRISLSCRNGYLKCRIKKLTAKYFHPSNNLCPNVSSHHECTTNATDVIHTCEEKEECAFYVREERQKGNCVNTSQYIDILYSCDCSVPKQSCPSSHYPMKAFGMLCYELVPEVRTYTESVQVCKSKNGVLADITSYSILEFLREFLDKQYMYGYQWVGNASRLIKAIGYDHCYELRKDRGSVWNISLSACTYRNQFICQYDPSFPAPVTSLPPLVRTSVKTIPGNGTEILNSAGVIHIGPVVAMLIAIGVSILLFIIVLTIICCMRKKDSQLITRSSANGRVKQQDVELKICENSNGSVQRAGVDNPAFEHIERPDYPQVVKYRKTHSPPVQHAYDDVCNDNEDDNGQVDGICEFPVLPPRCRNENPNDSRVSGPTKRPHYENVFIPNIANSLKRKFKGDRSKKNQEQISNEAHSENIEEPHNSNVPLSADTFQDAGSSNVYANCSGPEDLNKSNVISDESYYSDDVFNPADTLGRAQNVDTEDGPTEASDFRDVDDQPLYSTLEEEYPGHRDRVLTDEYDSFEEERRGNDFMFTPISDTSGIVESDMFNSVEMLNVTDADLGTI